MTRIVVANSRLEAAKKIALVLRSAGLAIAGVCTSGARAAEYTRGGDCIVVSGGYLTDLPAIRLPQLCERGTDFLFLLRGEELPAFENSEYLRLRLPLVKADLVASVNLLACFREPPGKGSAAECRRRAATSGTRQGAFDGAPWFHRETSAPFFAEKEYGNPTQIAGKCKAYAFRFLERELVHETEIYQDAGHCE